MKVSAPPLVPRTRLILTIFLFQVADKMVTVQEVGCDDDARSQKLLPLN